MVKKSSTRLNQIPISPLDALLHRLDEVAFGMEQRWGAGCLTSLCKPETAAKWVRVKEALDQAILGGDYDTVKAKSESLARGWKLMEQEAIEAGHNLPITGIWYVTLENGIQYAFAENELKAAQLVARNPAMASSVFTLEHIAEMLSKGSVDMLNAAHERYLTEEIKQRKIPMGKIIEDEIPF